jgi:hypothetical protein
MAIKCEKCNAECEEGTNFCNECGNKLQGLKCPKCNEAVTPDDKFCGSCGLPLAGGVGEPLETEEQEYDGPWRLTDVVREWIREVEMNVEPELKPDGESTTSFQPTLDERDLAAYFEVKEQPELFQLFMYCPDVRIPEERLKEAKEFLFHVNQGQWRGGLFDILIDEDGGVFRYINVIDVEGASFEPRHIENIMSACVSSLKARIPQMEAISKGKSAAEVLSEE